MDEVINAVEEYCDHLRSISNYYVDIEEGRKYFKIVASYSDSPSRHVHSFVDKNTGDLYKAATWNAPAKGIRFNLLTDMEKLKEVMDPYTSYLYKKNAT